VNGGHGLHALAPSQNVPRAQFTQASEELAPITAEKVPAEQASHDVAPVAPWYVPAGQGPQFCPNVPGSHGKHRVAPVESVKDPFAHCRHTVAPTRPSPVANIPWAQGWHPPACQYVPGRHSVQA
jgi:hypothetical protein